MNPQTRTPRTRRYVVETCFRPGVWRPVLTTDDPGRAATTANFWDERQDTRLIDLPTLTPTQRAMRRFDAAITRLDNAKEATR